MNFPIGLINGSIRPLPNITLSVTDLTVTRGVGVFESIVVEDKTPLFLSNYLDRFYTSAEHGAQRTNG
ncbi:hypothetical protein JCM19240_4226 [Vibrio maritimus]|uniref:Uncharacterized protein n=1 Tax=Vibrio maritimus TaxID=990268 RepID=A0A090T413_9VIBR|nr:hypothetical protein JCM19240_4226 [Vibrio maritimus]